MKIIIPLLTLTASLMATEPAFPPSPLAAPELKTLPAGVRLKATGKGNYFDQTNGLLRPLFNDISSPVSAWHATI